MKKWKNKNKFRKIRKTRIVLISIVIALLAVLSLITLNNVIFLRQQPHVYLIGDLVENLTVNTDYYDKGLLVKVRDENLDVSKYDYKSTNNINPSSLGKYYVNYEINLDGEIINLKREVNVVDDIKPVITTNSETYDKIVCGNSEVTNFSYQAIDNYDGVLTDKVVLKEVDNNMVLTVSDSSGNTTNINVPIKITDDVNFNIALEGKDYIYLPLGAKFNDPGVKVTNGCGEVMDASIVEVSSNLDNTKVGNYTITYSANKVKVTRTVVVYNQINGSVNDSNKQKVVYLTFDDGPGQYTSQLLDILDKYNVKATFFVTAQFGKYVPLIGEEARRGHTVAVHTLTHSWTIYRSVENYMKDFNDMNNIIEQYTGKKTSIFRFPGGSSNTVSRRYSTGVVSAIASKMTSLGYVYFDWNVDSRDAENKPRDQVYNNVVNGISKRNYSVVLMHDIKKPTLEAIEDIIKYAINNGYQFDVLTPTSPTVHHSINN